MVAELLLGLEIEQDYLAGSVHHDHGGRGGFEETAVSALHLREVDLGGLALADVAQDQLPGGDAEVRGGGGGGLDIYGRAVDPDNTKFDERDCFAAFEDAIADERPGVGVEQFEHGPTEQILGRRGPEQLHARRVRESDLATAGDQDGQRRTLGQRAVARLALSQRLLSVLALDCVADGSYQPRGIDLAFDEIVFRAFPQGSGGQRFVVQAREDHQRYAGSGRVGAPYRSESLGVG